MKLISISILLVLPIMEVRSQKYQQGNIPFPPHYQTPSSAVFTSDSSIYLPPESHTTIPYFPMKNVNNLQFPYLPPTGTKAPVLYPTPFPMMMSSSLNPNFDDDDGDNDGEVKINLSSPQPPVPQPQNKVNHTESRRFQAPEKREIRQMPMPRMVNYHQIDRNDMKFPMSFPSNPPTESSSQQPVNQTPPNRRMIISAEQRNDQIKTSSLLGPQFYPPPGNFISSTTEPAIPILRLSNEMDLDGSFSYEALGADQTHYVQHSRMENMGTEKEEQVVEGSYSYVGDNGQTYTVHYVADSNGFRASGDHLPVAPPIPEIIQRAVQYNLAEEAKRPAHLKSWQEEQKEYQEQQLRDIKPHHVPLPQLPPPRNLFTGRTPEAFSYSYGSNQPTQNSLIPPPSAQQTSKNDFSTDQSQNKVNSASTHVSPQITFLASQGAHIPSLNSIISNSNAAQQSISRMFTTEKTSLPQLMNYEANIKDSEAEGSKALWRWQYGLNANNVNQNQNKNTISRSSSDRDGDEIMINFNDMTSDQYTKMIQDQIQPNGVDQIDTTQYATSPPHQEALNKNTNIQFSNDPRYDKLNEGFHNDAEKSDSNKNMMTLSNSDDWYKKSYNNDNAYNIKNDQVTTIGNIKTQESRELVHPSSHSKLITQHNFLPPSLTVTQHYDYDDSFYEPRRIKSLNVNSNYNSFNAVTEETKKKHFDNVPSTENWINMNYFGSETKETTTTVPQQISSVDSLKFTDFIVKDKEENFKPIISSTVEPLEEKTTTTEVTVEQMFNNNIFLKNLIRPEAGKRDNSQNELSKTQFHSEIKENYYPKTEVEIPKQQPNVNTKAEPKHDKIPKYVQFHNKAFTEVKPLNNRPFDISDILNYVAQKNHFESSKVRPKSIKTFNQNPFEQRKEVKFIPRDDDQLEAGGYPEQNKNDIRNLNQQQQQEIQGIIKNYKVLQRNNIVRNTENENQLRRDLTPPKMHQKPGLPPLGRAGPSMKSYLPPIYV